MPQFGGNRLPSQDLMGGVGVFPGNAGPSRQPGLPSALGPAETRQDSWHGLGGKAAAAPASPMGYAAYQNSDPCRFLIHVLSMQCDSCRVHRHGTLLCLTCFSIWAHAQVPLFDATTCVYVLNNSDSRVSGKHAMPKADCVHAMMAG